MHAQDGRVRFLCAMPWALANAYPVMGGTGACAMPGAVLDSSCLGCLMPLPRLHMHTFAGTISLATGWWERSLPSWAPCRSCEQCAHSCRYRLWHVRCFTLGCNTGAACSAWHGGAPVPAALLQQPASLQVAPTAPPLACHVSKGHGCHGAAVSHSASLLRRAPSQCGPCYASCKGAHLPPRVLPPTP